MTGVQPEPIRRTTSRVVPVNSWGEVLLLHGCDPQRPEAPYWFTIGGAADPGETLSEAGVRELAEETGIVADPADLVGPYYRGEHAFDYDGRRLVNDSHFFAIRLDDVTVTFDRLEPAEVGTIFGSGWFAPDALPTAISHPDLPHLARLAVEAVDR